MTGLENIYIANNISYLYGGENVFLLPNIKNITIFDARLYIDVNKDFHNDSIEKIDIKYCNFDSINYNTYDYLDMNGILVIEWSENIADFLPEDTVYIHFSNQIQNNRTITIECSCEKNFLKEL